MITIEYVDIFGLKAAIRGMRNSFNSWGKCDSEFGCDDALCASCNFDPQWCGNTPKIQLGKSDLCLMKKLSKGGSSHAKFRRFIHVSLDITAPLYWWKEFDTYKVGTAANSCSTMHKIADKPFKMDDFSYEHFSLPSEGSTQNRYHSPYVWLNATCDILNYYRDLYNGTKSKEYWWQMIQMLPSSYNQKRTVDLNYEVLHSIYKDRKKHRLDEWIDFCKWIESLPYAEGVIFPEKDGE